MAYHRYGKRKEKKPPRVDDLNPRRSVAEWKRKQRLDALPKDRKCPGCGEIKLSLRQWVIRFFSGQSGVSAVICKSCLMIGHRPQVVHTALDDQEAHQIRLLTARIQNGDTLDGVP